MNHYKQFFLKLFVFVGIGIISCQNVIAQNDEYYGPLKISFYGFKCNQPTNDDPFGMDGVGDEISLMFETWSSVFNNTERFPAIGTVYGENFLAGSDRVKAGTATINGGIKAGDSYYREGVYGDDNPSMKSKYSIVNGFTSENALIAILPVMWERDKGDLSITPIQDFGVAARNAFNDMNIRKAMFNLRQQCENYNGSNPYAFIQFGSVLGIDNYFSGLFTDWNTKLSSRPIGILPNGQFRSKVLLFTPKMLMLLAQKDFGYGIGIIPVQYEDAAQGNTVGKGNYTLLLKIVADIKKRLPPPPPEPRPAVPPPAPTVFQLPEGGKPKKTIILTTPQSANLNNEILVGVWKGTMGTTSNNNVGLYHFKFNNNIFWMLDLQGSATASGGYQFVNGNFVATYIDKNGWKYEVSSTDYNSSSGELSGTWTCFEPTYGGTGKWIAKKVSN